MLLLKYILLNQMTNKLAILIFAHYLICISTFSQSVHVNVFDCIDKTKQVDLADITNRIQYIPLNSGKNAALIGRIRRIAANESYIVIYDDMTNRLMLFAENGFYLKDIMTKGKGPKEFIGITAIDVHTNNDILVLKNSEEIVIISAEGKIKEQFRVQGNPSHAKWLNGQTIILFYPYPDYLYNDGFEISFLDTKGKVLKNSLKNSLKHVDFNDLNPRYSCGWKENSLYYWNQFRDTVFTITQDMALLPRLILDQSKQRYSIELIKKGEMAKPGFSYNLGYVQNGYQEFRNMIFLALIYKDRLARIIVDPVSGVGYNLLHDYSKDHYLGFKNNLDGGSEFWPEFITAQGDMLMVVDPNKLRETFIKHQNAKMQTRFPSFQDSIRRNVIDKITLMDNPIIIKIEK